MTAILVPLIVVTVASFGLLGRLKVLEHGHKQKRTAIEEDLKKECATMIEKARKLDAGIVDALVADATLDQVIPQWHHDRGAVLTRIDHGRPWDWDQAALSAWHDNQKRVRCAHLEAALAKSHATAIAVTSAVTLIVAAIAFFVTNSSYFTAS